MSTPPSSSSVGKRSRAALAAAAAADEGSAAAMAGPSSKKARRAASQAEARRRVRQMLQDEAEDGQQPSPQHQAPAPKRTAAAARAPRASLGSDGAAAAAAAPSPSNHPPSAEDLEQAQVRDLLRRAQARRQGARKKQPAAAESSMPSRAPPPPPPQKTGFQSPTPPPTGGARRPSLSLQQPPPAVAPPHRRAPSPRTNRTTSSSPSCEAQVGLPPRGRLLGAAVPAPVPHREEQGRSDDEGGVALRPVPSPTRTTATDNDAGFFQEVRDEGVPPKSRRSWTRSIVPILGVAATMGAFAWLQHHPPRGTWLELPVSPSSPKASLQTGQGPPCYRTFPPAANSEFETLNSEGSASTVEWAAHCPKYLSEKLLPCPPHAVCQGGKIVACESFLWIPGEAPSSDVASSSPAPSSLWSSFAGLFKGTGPSSSAAITTVGRPDWPTSCVLSEQADVLLSSVISVLETWTVQNTCQIAGGAVPPSDVGRAASDEGPLFAYGEVLAELERRGRDADWLPDMLFPDAELFQELAEGRLRLQLQKTTSAAIDEDPVLSAASDENDEAATEEVVDSTALWIGLAAQHPLKLPPSCQVGKSLAGLLQFAVELVLRAFWFAVIVPLYHFAAFAVRVVWILFRDLPRVYSVVAAVGSLATVIAIAQLWNRRKERQRELRFREELETALRAATIVLRGESAPLPHLALRDAVHERVGGSSTKRHFNKILWPAVEAELVRDRRVAVHMRQGGDKALLWIGPKAH